MALQNKSTIFVVHSLLHDSIASKCMILAHSLLMFSLTLSCAGVGLDTRGFSLIPLLCSGILVIEVEAEDVEEADCDSHAEEAEDVKKQLEEAGAEVELK